LEDELYIPLSNRARKRRALRRSNDDSPWLCVDRRFLSQCFGGVTTISQRTLFPMNGSCQQQHAHTQVGLGWFFSAPLQDRNHSHADTHVSRERASLTTSTLHEEKNRAWALVVELKITKPGAPFWILSPCVLPVESVVSTLAL
jgi:hypothetical protein